MLDKFISYSVFVKNIIKKEKVDDLCELLP